MSFKRGALIVLEGCDRSGKSTQCKRLVEALNNKGIPSQLMRFPDRSTAIGKIINEYLTNKAELSDKAVHLLFSANRWELEPTMRKLLQEGTTLVIDRYSYSGVAFSGAKKNMSFEWCLQPETGLPKPDLVFLLSLKPEALEKRGGFGNERYEDTEMQKRVAENFRSLQKEYWKEIDADKSVEALTEELLDSTLTVINEVKFAPLKTLWS
nr:PREDICTED: thymidylate kinase [Bemisia tabaci]